MKRVLLTRAENAIEYFFIERILNGDATNFTYGQKQLATVIGFHENAVGQALFSLEERGWIRRYKDGYRNIIEFCLPERELNLRLSHCSEVVCKSITDIEFLTEFKSINEKYKQEIKQQRDQLQKDEEHKQLTKQKEKLVNDSQVCDFVDDLYKTLSDSFDSRSFKDKVKSVIRKFQMKYDYIEHDDSDDNPLTSDIEHKNKEVIDGYWETRKK